MYQCGYLKGENREKKTSYLRMSVIQKKQGNRSANQPDEEMKVKRPFWARCEKTNKKKACE